LSRSAAAMAEQALSARIRQRWRLQAVDDDLQAALGRRVLVAGRDLRNFGMELKSIEAGPLNLNDRQYDVLRRTREDTPPFVFQFTAPPHPWCFRVHALRDDSLSALGRRPYVTLTEAQAEAFTATLVMGMNFTTTHVESTQFTPTERRNRYPGTCLVCGGPVGVGRGRLLQPITAGRPWAVEHEGCRSANASSVEIVFDEGEPAFYLGNFSNESVPEEVWPEVTPPGDYSAPDLRGTHIQEAARVLRLMGVLDEAPEPIPPRPQLTLIRQQTSAAEIVERVLARIREERAGPKRDVEPAGPAQQLPPSAIVRCEGCGLVYELDLLGAATGDQAAECDDCGSPSYVIALTDDPVYLAGFGAGWDAHADALHQVKQQLADRIEDGPWVTQHARHVIRRPVPGPFSGSDRQWSYGGPIRGDPDAEPDFDNWDWEAIEEREQRARQKSAALPQCRICGQPMWLDQDGAHYACRNEDGHTAGGASDRFHPDAIAAARAHERECTRNHAPGETCPAQPDPDDLAQLWAGRARMAAARRDADIPLDDIDREALRRTRSDSA
jgi:hypothetical protein